MDADDLVSITTVTTPAEAEILRAALQAAGIPCEIGGSSQGGFAGVWGIDVLTRRRDEKAARKHLAMLQREARRALKARIARRKAARAGKPAPSEAIQELPPYGAVKRRRSRRPPGADAAEG